MSFNFSFSDKDLRYDAAIKRIIDNAWGHRQKSPTVDMLLNEVMELAQALHGGHEHPPEYELAQIGGIALNWLVNLLERKEGAPQ